MYQDQLRKIHPSNKDLGEMAEKKDRKDIKNAYKSPEWGYDVYTALKSHLRYKKQGHEYLERGIMTVSDLVPPKECRTKYYSELLNSDTPDAKQALRKLFRINSLYQHLR